MHTNSNEWEEEKVKNILDNLKIVQLTGIQERKRKHKLKISYP